MILCCASNNSFAHSSVANYPEKWECCG